MNTVNIIPSSLSIVNILEFMIVWKVLTRQKSGVRNFQHNLLQGLMQNPIMDSKLS